MDVQRSQSLANSYFCHSAYSMDSAAGVHHLRHLSRFPAPPPLSPMQKQTERYAHYFGFPWQNVYVDAVGISDWCYHEKWGRIQTDHYYYEVVTSDQTHYLILVGYDPLAIYEDLHDGQPYRLIGDTTKIVDRVFKGVAELKGTTVDELRELYGYRCLSIYPSRSEKLPAQ